MKYGYEKIDCACGGGNRQENQRECIKVHPRARRIGLRSIGNICKPPRMRRFADKYSPIQKQAGKQKRPVTEGIRTRERHISRADDERHKVVTEAGKNWLCVPEDHG